MEAKRRKNVETDKRATVHELPLVPEAKKEVRLDLKRLELRIVRSDSLLKNRLEDLDRITPGAIDGLRRCIVETGIIAPLLVTPGPGPGQFTIVDGHRRREVAVRLGVAELQVMVALGRESTELFLLLNKGTRAFKGDTWLTAFALAKDRDVVLRNAPSKTKGEIEGMVHVLGLARTVELGKQGKQAPSFMGPVNTLVGLFVKYNIESISDLQVAEWVLTHHKGGRIIWTEQARMNGAHKKMVDRFARCIRKNIPYRYIAR